MLERLHYLNRDPSRAVTHDETHQTHTGTQAANSVTKKHFSARRAGRSTALSEEQRAAVIDASDAASGSESDEMCQIGEWVP